MVRHDVNRVRDLEVAGEAQPDRDGLAVHERAVADPDRLVLHTEHLDRARDSDHRVAVLAADVLRGRRDLLVDRMQVCPGSRVLVVDDQIDDLRREHARVGLRLFRRAAAGSENRRQQDRSGESGHAFSIRSSPGSIETASVSEASRSE
jgi:hypothetical protein